VSGPSPGSGSTTRFPAFARVCLANVNGGPGSGLISLDLFAAPDSFRLFLTFFLPLGGRALFDFDTDFTMEDSPRLASRDELNLSTLQLVHCENSQLFSLSAGLGGEAVCHEDTTRSSCPYRDRGASFS